MNIFVIADDFTGAGDVGIQLKKYGFNVETYIDCSDIKEKENTVAVIDTDTRNKNKEISEKVIKNLMERFKDKKFDRFYKKIDSTLRGNLKSEISAVLDYINDNEKICIIAAFPRVARKTIEGRHYVFDVPISESEFSKDPVSPVTEDRFYKIFDNAEIINLEDVRGDLDQILLETKEKIIVFDAETENDLDRIACALVNTKLDKYVVGSAGIMNYLPKYWGYNKEKVFMLSGSCSAKNIKQLELFKTEYKEQIYYYKIDYSKNIEDNIKIIEKEYNAKKDIVVVSVDNEKDIKKTIELYKNKNDKINFFNFIEKYLTEISKYIIEKYKIKKIFLTGGETAVKVLRGVKLEYLNIEDEIDTGVVYYKDFKQNYTVITKPGAFGNEKIYINAYEKLKSVENIE